MTTTHSWPALAQPDPALPDNPARPGPSPIRPARLDNPCLAFPDPRFPTSPSDAVQLNPPRTTTQTRAAQLCPARHDAPILTCPARPLPAHATWHPMPTPSPSCLPASHPVPTAQRCPCLPAPDADPRRPFPSPVRQPMPLLLSAAHFAPHLTRLPSFPATRLAPAHPDIPAHPDPPQPAPTSHASPAPPVSAPTTRPQPTPPYLTPALPHPTNQGVMK